MDNTLDIKKWLQTQIAEESGLPVNEVTFDADFSTFKLDSLSLVSVTFELESILNKELNPTVFTEFNTINKLTEWLESQK